MGNERELSGGEGEWNHFLRYPLLARQFARPHPALQAHCAGEHLPCHWAQYLWERDVKEADSEHCIFALHSYLPCRAKRGAAHRISGVSHSLSVTGKNHQKQNPIFEGKYGYSVCILKPREKIL